MKDINFFELYLGRNKEKINLKLYIYGVMGIVGFLIVIILIVNIFRIYILGKSINDYSNKFNDLEI